MEPCNPCPTIGHTWIDTGRTGSGRRWRCSACGHFTYRHADDLPPGLELPADSAERPLGGGARRRGQSPIPDEPEAEISALVELLIPLLPVGAFGFMVRGILSTLIIELRHATPGELLELSRALVELAPVRGRYLAELILEGTDDDEYRQRGV